MGGLYKRLNHMNSFALVVVVLLSVLLVLADKEQLSFGMATARA
jgi:hypothetical protein